MSYDFAMLRSLGVLALGAIGLGLPLAACGSETKSEFPASSSEKDAGGSIGFPDITGNTYPAVDCKKMDIVFVIDNSSSMDQEQAALAANFPGFSKLINEYKNAQGDLLDYRIAIVSTDAVHDQGAFQRKRGLDPTNTTCDPGDTDKPWFDRTDTGLDEHFACRGRLGLLGDTRELPLESARLSVTKRQIDYTNTYKGENFIREDALLAIVVITDEDDGGGDHDVSLKPDPIATPDEYIASFDNVKAGFRGRWATAVIAGETHCFNGQFGTADQAVRLQDFVAKAKPNSVFSSICDKDFTTSLKAAFDVFAAACGSFPVK